MTKARTARARESAGLLLFRRRAGNLEVLLVHPGGPFWARRDEGAWSIPKGEIEHGEDNLAAARREFREETGHVPPEGPAFPLGSVRQAGGKIVHAWAIEGDWDPTRLVSNHFSMEWPPRSGRLKSFPEVDCAQWFTLAEARTKIRKGQAPLLDRLAARLTTEA